MSSNQPGKCPSCSGKALDRQGNLRPREGAFQLENPGSLYACRSCDLLFRYPYPPADVLMGLYAKMPTEFWSDECRPDFDLAESVVRSLQCGSVLDVGCFTGAFLTRLGARYTKYGIEASEGARSVAVSQGVDVIGRNISDLQNEPRRFQAVTMLDVIEHLVDPLDGLRRASRVLAPRGLLVVSTGNTASLSWRLLRLDYWYYFPEHVSFVNSSWLAWAAETLGMEIVFCRRFARFERPRRERLVEILRAACYWATEVGRGNQVIRSVLSRVYPFSRAARWERAPTTMSWPDHVLVALQRK